MEEQDKEQKKEQAASFVQELLAGWGVPATWAKVLTGAAIGALGALIALSQSGCVVTPEQASLVEGAYDFWVEVEAQK